MEGASKEARANLYWDSDHPRSTSATTTTGTVSPTESQDRGGRFSLRPRGRMAVSEAEADNRDRDSAVRAPAASIARSLHLYPGSAVAAGGDQERPQLQDVVFPHQSDER